METENTSDWIERKTDELRDRPLGNFAVCRGYDKLDYAKDYNSSKKEIFSDLTDSFIECNKYKSEAILKIMPDYVKKDYHYTSLTNLLLSTLKTRFESKMSWQPTQVDIVQLMLAHHPYRMFATSGVEAMIFNNMGSGSSDDLRSQLCRQTGKCKFVYTEYYGSQDFEGYWKYDSDCEVHKYHDDKEFKKESWYVYGVYLGKDGRRYMSDEELKDPKRPKNPIPKCKKMLKLHYGDIKLIPEQYNYLY